MQKRYATRKNRVDFCVNSNYAMSRKQSKTVAEKLQDIANYHFLAAVNGQLFSTLFHTLKHLITIQLNITLGTRGFFLALFGYGHER